MLSKPGEARRAGIAAPAAAIVSLLAAVSCCLPVGAFVAGAGFLGLAGLVGAARPYFVGLALASLALGFVRAYGIKSCRARRSRAGVVILWTAAALVAALFLFPQQIAGWLADRVGPASR
jgi:hypothetical protein